MTTERARLLRQVQNHSFALNEAALYLDGHPDNQKARAYFESKPPKDRHSCSMCGKMCAMRTTNRILEGLDVKFAEEEK